MQTAMLLIALGFGFKIFADASRNPKKSVKQLGRAVGLIMMAVSLCGTVCTVLTAIKYGKCFYYHCPTDHLGKITSSLDARGKPNCPFSAKGQISEAPKVE